MISIVIPTYNEAANVVRLHELLMKEVSGRAHEIIYVDGGSSDQTISVLEGLGARVVSGIAGRAHQLNKGAAVASGSHLYFLHADTLPPEGFMEVLEQQEFAKFRLKFNSSGYWFRFYERFSKSSRTWCSGGDQSLLVSRVLFDKVGGYSSVRIMEDYDLVRKLKKHRRLRVLKESVTTSARRYEEHGHVRLQLIYGLIQLMWHLKMSEAKMLKVYKRVL